MQGDDVLSGSHQSLVLIAEHLACALFVLTNGGQAVSYTHLDVYKRQGDSSGQSGLAVVNVTDGADVNMRLRTCLLYTSVEDKTPCTPSYSQTP